MNSLIAVFVGGGLGSLLRYGISIGLKSAGFIQFPLATLISNVLSSIVLGLVIYRFADNLNHVAFLFLAVGFCGGFSTFSTFSYETFEMLRNGQMAWAVANVLISVLLCVSLLYLTYKFVK